MPGFIYNTTRQHFIDVSHVGMLRITETILATTAIDGKKRYDIRAMIDGTEVCIFSDINYNVVSRTYDAIVDRMRCGRSKDLPLILEERDDT